MKYLDHWHNMMRLVKTKLAPSPKPKPRKEHSAVCPKKQWAETMWDGEVWKDGKKQAVGAWQKQWFRERGDSQKGTGEFGGSSSVWNCSVGEDSGEPLGLQGDQITQSSRQSTSNIHWKDWCWSWNSNTLATQSEEPTHLKWPWCWERLKVNGKGGNRGWDGWRPSLTQWTWVRVNSWRQWRTEEPGLL